MTLPLLVVILAAVALAAAVVAAVAVIQARAARRALREHDARPREDITTDRASAAPGHPFPDLARPIVPASPPVSMRSAAPVLVVEDEPGVRELIKRVLVRSGRDVVTVPGPHEALAALKRQPAITLMIADIVMPDMDGYGLAVEARALSPGIHIVFMSAFAQDAARHPESDGFLAKPFTTESLTSVVDAALGRPAA